MGSVVAVRRGIVFGMLVSQSSVSARYGLLVAGQIGIRGKTSPTAHRTGPLGGRTAARTKRRPHRRTGAGEVSILETS